MAYTSLTTRSAGDHTRASDYQLIDGNLDDHESRLLAIEGSVLPNGSFEVDDGTDPSNWTVTETGTGTASLETSDEVHGAQAIKGNCPANTDTVAWMSDTYQPCAVGQRLELQFWLKCSAAGLTVTAKVFWWYWTGSAFAAATTASDAAYSSTSNPTSWTRKRGQVVVPSGTNDATHYTVEFKVDGGGSATGYALFDGATVVDYIGLVPLGRTSKATITTDTTTTIDCSAQFDTDENARWVQAEFAVAVDDGFTMTVQGWRAGSWATVWSGNDTNIRMMLVPLNESNQFRVVTSGMNGTDSLTVYIAGAYGA